MPEKTISKERRAEIFEKYGKLNKQSIADWEQNQSPYLLDQIITNLFISVSELEIPEADFEDISELLSIHAKMFSHNPVQHLAILKAYRIIFRAKGFS